VSLIDIKKVVAEVSSK